MSHTVQRHRYWLVPVCIVLAGIVCLFGWQGLSAQTPVAPMDPAMGGTPGVVGAPAPGAAPAAASPTAEPTIAFRAVAPVGVKSANIKNWDGKITGFISFKYKTMDNRVIKVYLPAVYRTQTMTQSAWDTLFQCYGMDREAVIAQTEGELPNITLTPEQINAAMNILPSEHMYGGAPSPASGAMDRARESLPSLWAAGEVAAPIF